MTHRAPATLAGAFDEPHERTDDAVEVCLELGRDGRNVAEGAAISKQATISRAEPSAL